MKWSTQPSTSFGDGDGDGDGDDILLLPASFMWYPHRKYWIEAPRRLCLFSFPFPVAVGVDKCRTGERRYDARLTMVGIAIADSGAGVVLKTYSAVQCTGVSARLRVIGIPQKGGLVWMQPKPLDNSDGGMMVGLRSGRKRTEMAMMWRFSPSLERRMEYISASPQPINLDEQRPKSTIEWMKERTLI